MEDVWGGDLASPDNPRFASYATLRRGIGYEKEYAEWCRWVADSIQRRQPSEKPKKSKSVR
jgi:hypothetical protein